MDKKAWSEEFKQDNKDAYMRFEKEGFSLSSHVLSRLPRLSKQGYSTLSEEDMLILLKRGSNFAEGDRAVYFDKDLQLTMVQSNETKDIVSVIRRKEPKEGWERVQ